MGFFYFVEQNDTVRFSPDSLGQLAALVVAHISRRRTDESRHAVAFLIFAHIDTHHHVLIVEHHLGQSACQFGFAHTRSAKEEETAYRSAAVA